MTLYKRNDLFAVVLALVLAASTSFGWAQAPATTSTLSATERQLVESIRVDTIKEAVNVLSSDEMQGRGTAQPGGEKAATYLAERFTKLGLKPLGDNTTYLQSIKFKETQVMPETNISLGNQILKLGQDFFVVPPFTGDENVTGSLVFAAYGAALPGSSRNDFSGLDVRGKVVVLREGPPPEVNKDAWNKAQGQISAIRGLIGRGVGAIVLI